MPGIAGPRENKAIKNSLNTLKKKSKMNAQDAQEIGVTVIDPLKDQGESTLTVLTLAMTGAV